MADVAAGGLFTCARMTDNTLWCWGRNQNGLGDGTTEDKLSPIEVPVPACP